MVRVARNFLGLCALSLAFGQVYVTYSFSGGRFGDNLASYVHAKWFAYKHGYQLIYRPFTYSNRLAISDDEKPYRHLLKGAVVVPKNREISQELLASLEKKEGDTTFHIDYFPPALPALYNKLYDNNFHTNLGVDWNDTAFVKMLRATIKSKRKIPTVKKRAEAVNIALHFRRGSYYDDPHADHLDPLKFPPLEYVCNQLKQCCALFPEKSLYVFLFTDFAKPKEIVNYLTRELGGKKISFGYHYNSRGYRGRTLIDFFSMMDFDCIIRSASSYSTLAAKISPCWLEIGPKNFAFVDGKPRITEVEFRYRPEMVGDAIKNLKAVPYETHCVEVKAQ